MGGRGLLHCMVASRVGMYRFRLDFRVWGLFWSLCRFFIPLEGTCRSVLGGSWDLVGRGQSTPIRVRGSYN